MKRTLQLLFFILFAIVVARGQTTEQNGRRTTKEKVYRWSYDINADGNVNIADITSLVQTLVSGTKGQKLLLANETERYSCDLNNDGTVSTADIDTLVDAILRNLKGEYLELLSIEIENGGNASENKDGEGKLPPLDSKKR